MILFSCPSFPTAPQVDVQLRESDLRIETMRASGATPLATSCPPEQPWSLSLNPVC